MTTQAFDTRDTFEPSTGSRLPRRSAVLIEQVRATGFVLWKPAAVGVGLAFLFTIMIVIRIVNRGLTFDLDAEPSPIYGLVGVLLPIAVWARDERFGPGFLWTLPVDRRQHALTKVLAGWVWLVGGIALSVVWLAVITLASGGRLLPPETIHLLTSTVPASGIADLSAFRVATWTPGFFIGLVPFTAATATYMLGSALWLGLRHPIRWIIGAVLCFAFASVASHTVGTQLGLEWLDGAPERGLKWLVEARYGLDALLTARTATLDTGVRLATGERVSAWSAMPDMTDWLVATLLGTALGAILLWAAASRHREGRRR